MNDRDPLFDAIETLCTVSASQPSLPETTSIVIDSNMVENRDQLKESELLCVLCNREFKTATQVKHHLASRHLNIRPFKCNFALCHSSFSQVAHLKAHRRTHSGERPFHCQVCDSSFIQLSHLKTHQKLHTGEKPFACDICDSRFRQQSNLNSHRLIHTGERPYKCDFCNASFVQVGHLKSHIRIHTDERPYKCRECLAAFRQISNLRNHEKSHQNKKLKTMRSSKLNNKEKPSKTENTFTCTECDFSSTAKENVLFHFRAFHAELLAKKKTQNSGSLIFMCSDCGACFDNCERIKSHMKLHAGSKRLQCSSCEESFFNAAEMLKHHNLQHSDCVDGSIDLKTFDSDCEDSHKLDKKLENSSDPDKLSSMIDSSCQVLFIEEREGIFKNERDPEFTVDKHV